MGRAHLSLLREGKRLAVLGQNMAADGRLVEGARFSFLFKKVLGVYARRLKEGPLPQRLATAAAFTGVDRIRFRLLLQSQSAAQQTHGDKQGIKQTVAEKQDEAAFLKALKLLDAGQQPDLATLEAAHRHADRLQQEYGLPGERRSEAR